MVAVQPDDLSEGWWVVAGAHMIEAFYDARKDCARGTNANVDASEDGGINCTVLRENTPRDGIKYFKDTGNITNDLAGTVTQFTEAVDSIEEMDAEFYQYRSVEIARRTASDNADPGSADEGADDVNKKKVARKENRVDKMYKPWLARNHAEKFPTYYGLLAARAFRNDMVSMSLWEPFKLWAEEHVDFAALDSKSNNNLFLLLKAVVQTIQALGEKYPAVIIS